MRTFGSTFSWIVCFGVRRLAAAFPGIAVSADPKRPSLLRVIQASLDKARFALDYPILRLKNWIRTANSGNRDDYYDALQRVRTHGDWEGWVHFFLQGVANTARLATETARRLLDLFDRDRDKLQAFKRGAGSAIRVQQYLQAHSIAAATDMADALDLSPPAVRSALARLEDAGVAREITGRARYKLYVYDQYLKILAEGAEPLPR